MATKKSISQRIKELQEKEAKQKSKAELKKAISDAREKLKKLK